MFPPVPPTFSYTSPAVPPTAPLAAPCGGREEDSDKDVDTVRLEDMDVGIPLEDDGDKKTVTGWYLPLTDE